MNVMTANMEAVQHQEVRYSPFVFDFHPSEKNRSGSSAQFLTFIRTQPHRSATVYSILAGGIINKSLPIYAWTRNDKASLRDAVQGVSYDAPYQPN